MGFQGGHLGNAAGLNRSSPVGPKGEAAGWSERGGTAAAADEWLPPLLLLILSTSARLFIVSSFITDTGDARNRHAQSNSLHLALASRASGLGPDESASLDSTPPMREVAGIVGRKDAALKAPRVDICTRRMLVSINVKQTSQDTHQSRAARE